MTRELGPILYVVVAVVGLACAQFSLGCPTCGTVGIGDCCEQLILGLSASGCTLTCDGRCEPGELWSEPNCGTYHLLAQYDCDCTGLGSKCDQDPNHVFIPAYTVYQCDAGFCQCTLREGLCDFLDPFYCQEYCDVLYTYPVSGCKCLEDLSW